MGKLKLTNLLIVVSLVFSLGGAFNVGMSGFWMAAPFMLFLVVLSFKRSRKFFVFSSIFVVICIIINLTIDKNPLVFPVLREGTQIEILKNSLYRSFSDGSGSFIEGKDIYINEPTTEQRDQLDSFLKNDRMSLMQISDSAIVSSDNIQTIYKLKAGQRFSVLGVYNFGGIDSENQNYLVTALGRVGEDEMQKGNIRIVPDVPVQSKWSKYVGNLMYWPVAPLLVLTALR